MNKKLNLRFVAMIACIALVSLCLTACGGAGNNGEDEQASMEPFIGTWNIESYQDDELDDVMTAEDFAELGLSNWEFIVKDDNTIYANVFGEEASGTWELKGDNAILVTANNSEDVLTLVDGKLVMEDESSKFVFTK